MGTLEVSLTLARVIGIVTPWALPLSIVILIVAGIVDLTKKKFHWLKFALILLAVTVILIIIQIALAYQVTDSILRP